MAPPIRILDLDSLANKPVVVIDGTDYLLLTPQLLPPLDSYRLKQYGDRIEELRVKKPLTEDDEREMVKLLDQMCRLVLIAPEDVHAKLLDRQRTAVLEGFLDAPLMVLAAREASQPNQTGATPSLDLSASTEEIH